MDGLDEHGWWLGMKKCGLDVRLALGP